MNTPDNIVDVRNPLHIIFGPGLDGYVLIANRIGDGAGIYESRDIVGGRWRTRYCLRYPDPDGTIVPLADPAQSVYV